MASFSGYTKLTSTQPETTLVLGVFTVDADGVTVTDSLPRLVSDFSKDGYHTYSLKLAQCFHTLLAVDIKPICAKSSVRLPQIVSHNIGEDGTSDGDQGFDLVFLDAAGDPQALPEGAQVSVLIHLKNSSADAGTV